MHLFQAGSIIVTACSAGVSDKQMNRLQSVLRSAARLVLRKRKFDPVLNDLRERLHWLPIRQRMPVQALGLLVYKCLHGLAPSYLSDMLALVSSDPYSCRLRSAAHGDLTVPWTRTVQMGPRSFAVSVRAKILELFGTGTKTFQHFTHILQIPAKE